VVRRVQTTIADARSGLLGRAWLFGSFAWGMHEPQSDVDLLVERASDSFAVASFVGGRSNRQVHVVSIEGAPESVKTRVLEEGLLL